MKKLLLKMIRFYRRHISPYKPACCRFTPTCSAYALQAFEKRGFVVGMILTVSRIFRCQPFCVGGWDPVPEKGLRNPKARTRPMTKYYYPEEYGLETDGSTDESES